MWLFSNVLIDGHTTIKTTNVNAWDAVFIVAWFHFYTTTATASAVRNTICGVFHEYYTAQMKISQWKASHFQTVYLSAILRYVK